MLYYTMIGHMFLDGIVNMSETHIDTFENLTQTLTNAYQRLPNMGCTVSTAKPKQQKPPETWIEYGREMDLEFAERLDEFMKRQVALRAGRSDLSIDDKVYRLIIETDLRVAVFYNWAMKWMVFSNIHKTSKDDKIIARCLKPFWMASVPGDVIWRGIKDEKTTPVITRATELGWEPVKTRLNRILSPSTVSDCGSITWNIVQ